MKKDSFEGRCIPPLYYGNFMKKLNKSAFGVIAAALGGTFWGFSGCFGQYLFTYKNVTSSWLVPIRLLVSGLLILMLLTAQKKNIFVVYEDKKNILKMLIFALFGMALSQYGYFTAVMYSNAGTGTILQYTGQIMLLVYVCVVTPRLPKKNETLALILSTIGVFIMATHGRIGELALRPEAIFWGVFAAIGFVCYSVQPAKMIEKYTVLPVLGWGMFLGGIMLCVSMRPWTIDVIIDYQVILLFLGIVILGTIMAYYLILTSISLIGPVKTSLIACVEPVVATLVAFIWLKTSFAAMDIIGAGLVLLAVVVITRNDEKQN